MKLLLPALLALAAVLPARADLVLVQKVDGMGQAGEMTMKVGPDKLRADISPQVSTITDTKSGDITTLMHQQKSYMVISASSARGMMDQMRKAMAQTNGAPAGPPKLVSTGKTAMINGYNAAEYTFANGNLKGTYWISADYKNAKEISAALVKFQQGGLASMTKDLVPDLSTVPGVPIKTEVEMNGQKIVTELKSATEQAVDPSEYQVPAGYTEMKMPAMPQP